MIQNVQKLLKDSPTVRWSALILIALTMLAAYFFVDMIAPLQKLLQVNQGWSAGAYGFFSGSEYMLNVCGFLILSGIILDKMGIRFTGLTATIVMVLGGIIKMYGLSETFNNGGFGYQFFNSFLTQLPAAAKMAAFGYAIFGIGVEMVGITVSKAIVKWFKGKELALAMGMEMAIARLGASVAFFFSAIIAGYKETPDGFVEGNVMNTVYVGLAFLCIGFLTFLIYTFLDKKLDNQMGVAGATSKEDEFKISDIGKIFANPGFWLISLLCVLFYSGVFPFLKYAVNLMQNELGVSAQTAGYISGLLPVGTIILTPLIGNIYDRKGKGATMLIMGALLLMCAHLTFALAPMSMALAIAAIIVLGIAFSLVPAALWSSMPKIVEDRFLGTGYGLIFWIQNIGLMIFPMLIGVILDAVNPGVAEKLAAGEKALYNYTVPMLVFAALGLCAAILGFMLRRLDAVKGYGLEKPNINK
jgi:MFS family permease